MVVVVVVVRVVKVLVVVVVVVVVVVSATSVLDTSKNIHIYTILFRITSLHDLKSNQNLQDQ